MYYVVTDDGQKYGPADLDTLKQWQAENRLTPTTKLEEASTGKQLDAAQVPGLFGNPDAGPGDVTAAQTPDPQNPVGGLGQPGQGTPSQPHVPTSPYNPQAGVGPMGDSPSPANPDPAESPYATPTAQPNQPGGEPSSPYGSPNAPSSPYDQHAPGGGQSPYGSAGPQADYLRYQNTGNGGQQWATWGWIVSTLSICCCWCVFGPLGIYFANRAKQEGYEKHQALLIYAIVMMVLGLIIGIILNASGTLADLQNLG